MDYSLGECIAARVCDFSEGDFSKFGNAVRKGAIIGAMGLTALAPVKAMSIEDQIKADTRAYTQTVGAHTYEDAGSVVGKISDYKRSYKEDPNDLWAGWKDSFNPKADRLVEESLRFKKNTTGPINGYVWNGLSHNKDELLKNYEKGDYNNTTKSMVLPTLQQKFERQLDDKTAIDSLAGKIYKRNKQEGIPEKSIGDHLKDAWDSTSEAAKKTGEKISEKAGEAWDWTKDTAKNVGDKVSEGAGKAWNWMKGAGSKIADKISGSKNSDKEFSEGDFGINLSKIRNAGRTAALTAIIAGTATFGGWAGNKVGSSNLAIPKAQRTAIVQMEKAADNYDADAAIARLADINLAASGKAVENTGKSKAYNVAADTLREEAKSVRNKATKTSRGWGTFLGSLAGAAGGAGAIGAAKRKKKENELIDKYMNNSSSAGTP